MSPGGTKPYRLRPAAILDLENIWKFTAARWSVAQADKYLTDMARAFERIAESPHLARERTEYAPPVRIHRHQAHVIVYLDEADHIDVIRIRHGGEDWLSDPAEGGGMPM